MLYKKWTDYLDDIYKEYPYIPKRIIRFIVSYGFRRLYKTGLSVRYKVFVNDGDFEISTGFSSTNNTPSVSRKNLSVYERFFIPKWIKFEEFNGYYYIPVTYAQFIPLKRSERTVNRLDNIIVTTSLEAAFVKSEYVIKVRSIKDYGCINKIKVIFFIDYEAYVRDNYYIIEDKSKIKEDV